MAKMIGWAGWDKNVLRVIFVLVRILLLIAIAVDILFTVELLYQKIPEGASAITQDMTTLVSGSLLALAIMDIYLSVGVYSRGDIKNLVYIIDAAVFFVIRDIVIQLFGGESTPAYSTDMYRVGILGGVVLALVVARYLAITSSLKIEQIDKEQVT